MKPWNQQRVCLHGSELFFPDRRNRYQRLPRLKELGYPGGPSILRTFVQHVRPAPSPAFLTLQFAPGECAQVDSGQAGAVRVDSTRRRLSFFVMVRCHSRMR